VPQSTLLASPSFVLVASGVLALAASLALIGAYRRSVVRLMSVRIDEPAAQSWSAHPPSGPPPARSGWGVAAELRRRRTLHIAVTIGAGLFVGITYAALFLVWNDLAFRPVRYGLLVFAFSWPAVPGVWVASDGDLRWTGWTAVALLVPFAVLLGPARIGLRDGAVDWVTVNGVATAVVAIFFTRAFRAIGVCLLCLALAALVGSQALVGSLDSVTVGRGPLGLGGAPGVGLGVGDSELLYWGTTVAGFALAVGLGWLCFWWLARWYARQGYSDHMLLLGSVCLVFCLDYVSIVGLGEPVLLAVGLLLFALLGLLTVLAFGLLVPDVVPRRLLVLRVFGHTPRSVRLLAAVGARWRHLGPVAMIGGPDLATSNVGPDEFLTFMGGRLRRLFVASRRDLTDRLRTAPAGPDPDGRFRLEELFCFDTTWRPAVEALLARSDVVLMDLRDFTPHRAGARHELELLARTGAFTRTVLVVDASTDARLVESILAAGGAAAGPARPRMVVLSSPDPGPVVDALAGGPST
jgi:hypothetical protein